MVLILQEKGVHWRTVNWNTSKPDLTHILEHILYFECSYHVIFIISFCWVNVSFHSFAASFCLKEDTQIFAWSACGRGCQVGCIWIIWWDEEAIAIRQRSQSGKWQPKKIWGEKKVFTPMFESCDEFRFFHSEKKKDVLFSTLVMFGTTFVWMTIFTIRHTV